MWDKNREKAQKKYNEKMTKGVYLKLNIGTDKDILDKLDSVNNKQRYIKDLIRKDISNG